MKEWIELFKQARELNLTAEEVKEWMREAKGEQGEPCKLKTLKELPK